MMVAALLLSAPLAWAGKEAPVLNVYNWADYIAPETIPNFEKEFGIKVNYDIYDNSEVVDAKLMAGKSGYDVIIHAGSFSNRLIAAGLYRKLDKSELSNWHNLDPRLLSLFQEFDPGNQYGVPFMWGTLGFSYNVDMIRARMPDAPVDSGAFMFDPKVVSRFADCGVSLLDSPIDVIPMAMIYLGYPSNSVDPKQLKDVENLIKGIRPYIKYFSSTKALIDLPAKEVCMAMTWSGDYSVAARNARDAGIKINLAYAMPKEGMPLWVDFIFIPADAPHPENAHKFINYLLRPEVIAAISNFTGYANVNRAATQFVKPEYTNDPAIYPTPDIVSRLYPQRLYSPKIERVRTRTWTRIKSGL